MGRGSEVCRQLERQCVEGGCSGYEGVPNAGTPAAPANR